MAGEGELVARGGRRVGVVDHVVDVRVLEQQRSPAGAVELVPEGVHGWTVDVSDGANRAHRDVPGRVTGAHRRPWNERLHGEVGDLAGAGRGGEDDPAGALAGSLDQSEHGRRQPAHRQRREQWPRLDRQPRQVRRGLDGLAEHLLDRRHEHHVVSVLPDSFGDRARVLGRAERVGAVDRRAREPLGDAGGVDRRPGHLHEDPRPLARRVHDVDHLNVERRDRRALNHGLARAVHSGLHLRQRHDRAAIGPRGARGKAHPRQHEEDQQSKAQISRPLEGRPRPRAVRTAYPGGGG